MRKADILYEFTESTLYVCLDGRDIFLLKDETPPDLWERMERHLMDFVSTFGDLEKVHQAKR